MPKIFPTLILTLFLTNCTSTLENMRLGASLPGSKESFDEKVSILKHKIDVIEAKRGSFDEFDSSYENELSEDDMKKLEKLKDEYSFIMIYGSDKNWIED